VQQALEVGITLAVHERPEVRPVPLLGPHRRHQAISPEVVARPGAVASTPGSTPARPYVWPPGDYEAITLGIPSTA